MEYSDQLFIYLECFFLKYVQIFMYTICLYLFDRAFEAIKKRTTTKLAKLDLE